jgi:hypothetical protein
MPGDDHSLDLSSTFVELQDFGIAHPLHHWLVAHVTLFIGEVEGNHPTPPVFCWANLSST